jgi:hypothetical protein
VFVPSVPQGQYCRLTLNITNASDFPATIDTIGAYLYDGQQRQFALDSEATTTANSDREVGPYEELNPGMAVTYDVVYDLPADALVMFSVSRQYCPCGTEGTNTSESIRWMPQVTPCTAIVQPPSSTGWPGAASTGWGIS